MFKHLSTTILFPCFLSIYLFLLLFFLSFVFFVVVISSLYVGRGRPYSEVNCTCFLNWSRLHFCSLFSLSNEMEHRYPHQWSNKVTETMNACVHFPAIYSYFLTFHSNRKYYFFFCSRFHKYCFISHFVVSYYCITLIFIQSYYLQNFR